MKLSMTGQMQMQQRMTLAPRMIQSMEILQLPMLALQERIEQELGSNPVLELARPDSTEEHGQENDGATSSQEEISEGEKSLIIEDGGSQVQDFERLDNLDYNFHEYLGRAGPVRTRASPDEPDRKLEAMQNTPAGPRSLNEYLHEQWRLVDTNKPVHKAGQAIIDYLDDRGYLTVRLEQLQNKDKKDFNLRDLEKALKLLQTLDPPGVGARDIKECLLIQLAQRSEDLSFEKELVTNHLDKLIANHLPEIARKMECTIERINQAIGVLSKLDTSPGLLIGKNDNYPITADVIVEPDDQGQYRVRLAETRLPQLKISDFYSHLSRDKKMDQKTREFLQNNIRSAHWLMDAIEQRKQTLLRVTQAVVKHQKEFFEKGTLYLKPLPMATVAQDVGVHIATVSRAVAGKYVQCSQGILPLRKFFTGGTEAEDGSVHSWDAIRAKLQQVVDNEDKGKPLNDEQIQMKLEEMGIKNIARRTVAKYRKLLKIPVARFRRKY
ncbi:MAG: RNA polymerase factor sigma-54 [Planctomycetota bacterium]